MAKYNFKEIPSSDKNQIQTLSDECMSCLERKEFFIPLSQMDVDNLFNKDYGINIGAYHDNTLVGMATLYVDQNERSFTRNHLSLSNKEKICQLGNYLVSKDHRGQGIIRTLQTKLIDLAKGMKFDYAVATAHPQNLASVNTLLKELDIVDTIDYKGYSRHLFVKKL